MFGYGIFGIGGGVGNDKDGIFAKKGKTVCRISFFCFLSGEQKNSFFFDGGCVMVPIIIMGGAF